MSSEQISRAKRPVLVISNADDAHLPYVLNHLKVPHILADPLDMTKGTELSFFNTMNGSKIQYGGKSLTDVRSVWYRKPHPILEKEMPTKAVYRPYSRSAVERHAHALYTQLPDALWVSDYFAMYRAEYKPLQLSVARQMSFNVPDTVFTSDSKVAKQFIAARPATIVKSLSTEFPETPDGKATVFFATKVQRDEALSFDGLHIAPAILQEAIDPEFDIRVTVIADKIFSAAITTTGVEGHEKTRDWRIGNYSGKINISTYDLGSELEEKCITLVKQLGLQFGAIDLILDKQGKMWFLEINPNGQWAFIEDATEQLIGKSIATLLENA